MTKDNPDGYMSVGSAPISELVSQAYESDFSWEQVSIPAGEDQAYTLYNSYEDYVYQLLGYRIMCIDDVDFHAFLYRGVVYEGYVKVKCQYEFLYPSRYNVFLAHDDYFSINVFNPLAGAHIVNVTYYYNKFIKPTDWVMRPRASFNADDYSPAVDQVVSFTDTSTNTPTSWSWQFGDGSLSQLKNPTHAYASPGTYNVILGARNVAGASYKQTSVVVT